MTDPANVGPAVRHVHHAGNVLRRHSKLRFQHSPRASVGKPGDLTHRRQRPLRNTPELLSAYWRTDFDRDPTATNGNGDTVADWALTGGGTFDSTKLSNGIWTATGAIESRPLADFTTTTSVEVRCRNTSTGGNGAVMCINADRQGGQYAPLLVYVQLQSDGTQTLTLNGKTDDSDVQTAISAVRNYRAVSSATKSPSYRPTTWSI